MVKKVGDEKQIKFFTILIVVLLMIFLAVAIVLKNKEFIYYDAILLPLVLLVYVLHRKLRLHLPILGLIWFVFLMHAAAGVMFFQGMRLYDMVFWIFKYDNIVHFFGIFTVAFVVYNLIHTRFSDRCNLGNLYLFLILSLMAMGFGTLIELVELIGVIWLDAGAGVGDYMNNAIDLFYNALGAIVGAGIITYYHNRKYFKKNILKD
ncbi:MAG: hypothetical protein KKF56_00835 [Nanoarchaeota archaeon]|nr:hypothetical protein [Nanoarchaeota archaeon]